MSAPNRNSSGSSRRSLYSASRQASYSQGIPHNPSTRRIYTPPSGGQVMQTFFPMDRLANSHHIVDPVAIRILQDCIAVARRLLFCSRGKAITRHNLGVQPGSDHGTPNLWNGDLDTHFYLDPEIRRYKHGQNMTVIVDTTMRSDGRVKPSHPTQIRINHQLLKDAAESRHMGSDVHTIHLFYLSVCIAHEAQHAMRMLSRLAAYDTPAAVIGEGGWAFEFQFFGGLLTPCLSPSNRQMEQFDSFILRRPGTNGDTFFEVDHAVIHNLWTGQPGWEGLLPILPSDGALVHDGQHPQARLRLENEKDTSSQSAHTIVLKSRTCGHRDNEEL